MTARLPVIAVVFFTLSVLTNLVVLHDLRDQRVKLIQYQVQILVPNHLLGDNLGLYYLYIRETFVIFELIYSSYVSVL